MVVILKNLLLLTPLLLVVLTVTNVILSNSRQLNKNADVFVLTLLVLLVTISFLTSLVGHLEVGTKKVFVFVAVLTVVAASIGALAMLRRSNLFTNPWNSVLKRIITFVPGFFVSTYAMIPQYIHLSQAGVAYGIVTLFNGDIANYSLVGDNVLAAGFGDSGHIANANYGIFAGQNSYTTANGIFGLLSSTLNRPTFQVVLPTMTLSIIFLYFSLRLLLRSLVTTTKSTEISILAFSILNSLTVYSIGQYFLSSILATASIALVIGSLLKIEDQTDQGGTKVYIATLVLAMSLSIYAYGHIGIVLTFGVPVLGGFVHWLSGRHREINYRLAGIFHRFTRYVAASLVALLFSTPALPSAWNLLRAQGSAQVGYELRDLNPIGLFFAPSWIRPSWTSGNISIWWNLLTWTLSAAALALLCLMVYKKFRRLNAIALLTGTIILFILPVFVWGSDSYQTWKLWSLVLPILIVLAGSLLAMLSTTKRDSTNILFGILVGISLTIPWAVWNEILWNPSVNTVSTLELQASTAIADGLEYSTLNIKLNPYLETMMAGAMFKDTSVIFSSESYLGQPLTGSQFCTFTREEFVPKGVSYRVLLKPYVLADYPATCR